MFIQSLLFKYQLSCLCSYNLQLLEKHLNSVIFRENLSSHGCKYTKGFPMVQTFLYSSQLAAPSCLLSPSTQKSLCRGSSPFPPPPASFSLFRAQACNATLYLNQEVPFHSTGALSGVSGTFSMEHLTHPPSLQTQCKFNYLLCLDDIFPPKSDDGGIPRDRYRELCPSYHIRRHSTVYQPAMKIMLSEIVIP